MTFFAIAVAMGLAWNSQAEVRTTRFDPPLSVQWSSFGCIPLDIDLDGRRDFTFSAAGSVKCFMEAHNAVVIQSPVVYPTGTDMDSDAAWMGALPFGTSIGKELSSTVELSGYSWSSGTVVSGEGPQIPGMGDHESILVGSGFSQTPGFILPRGDVSIPLPVHNPKGNILGKEGVLALQFSTPLSGGGTSDVSSPHFGYVHFDFPNTDNPRTGTLRILGWAYETEPNKPIVAKPLNSLSETAASPVSDFTYEIREGEVTITAYTGSEEHVVIPSEIEGLPVTELGHRAFRENMQLKSFVLPDSLKRIGNQCFGLCKNLETVEIPAQVEKIDNLAFAGCLRLSRVTLPASVAEIGASVFNCCPELIEIIVSEDNSDYSSRDGVLFDEEQTTLIRYPSNRAAVEYTIPETVKGMSPWAFDYCQNLETVVIPDGLTVIDPGAFARCSSLQRIDIPNTVTNIGMLAFDLCSQLREVNIGSGVTHIEDSAFRYCPQLREITIPDNVLSLGDSTFLNCAGLETVRIGNGVTEIKGNTFKDCPRLKEVSMGNDVTLIGGGAFHGCTSLINPGIGNNVTRIEHNAFYGCTNLQEIVLPDTLTRIGDMAFRDCMSLTNVVIPDSVLFIGNEAFNGCLSLKTVVIGDGISNFLSKTFAECVNLETVRLGAVLTSMGGETFTGCLNLKWMDVSPDSPFFCSVDGILFNKTMSQLAFYPPNYPNTEYTVPDGVKEVYGLGQCLNLKRVTLPFSVERISSFSKSITDAYFKGNAPGAIGYIPGYFTIYYLKGTVGWTKTRFSWLEFFTLETWTLPADEPEVFVPKKTVKDGKVEMTLVFGGALQSSTNLKDWETVETASPYQVSVPVGSVKFYRTIAVEVEPPSR